ncbi:hypothetical protein GCM10010156_29520 [Planobispora rosea]|uniref:Anti-sigma factor antagonist n=1 Tax=Planobispora rosea TaxID=35762 RepID=A0A8J3WAP5_PLARO|nr:STAS domain-containing protein [Planobispora rosea]GGS68686.1 hypothetical protein GCM10010156_29520 [Planobispora rosea]GIH82037.1 hypothetical protein Pro02_04450 [Planobispora rosea]
MSSDPDSDPESIFTVTVGLYAGVLVVRATGQLTEVSAPLLRARLSSLWDFADIPTIIIDLDDVVFCDSAGLAELIDAQRHSRAHGRHLILAGPGTQLTQLLEITGLRTHFEIHPGTAPALRAAIRARARPGTGVPLAQAGTDSSSAPSKGG